MRFGLQKGGRWLAGRLQGSKGVQKYDQYMKENPWASRALDVADIAAATLGGAALLGGGSVGAGFKTAGAGLSKAGSGIKGLLTGRPETYSKIGTFAKENKDLLTLAGKGIMATMPDAASDAAMMNAETTRMRLEEERRQAQMEEERRRRLAELLMPMARQTFPGYFGNT